MPQGVVSIISTTTLKCKLDPLAPAAGDIKKFTFTVRNTASALPFALPLFSYGAVLVTVVFCVQIKNAADGRDYKMRAESRDDLVRWIVALHDVVTIVSGQRATISASPH